MVCSAFGSEEHFKMSPAVLNSFYTTTQLTNTDQGFKVSLKQGREEVNIGSSVTEGRCLSPVLFKRYSQHLTGEVLVSFGGFKVRGQLICTVKYVNYVVQLAKEETLLQSMVIGCLNWEWKITL